MHPKFRIAKASNKKVRWPFDSGVTVALLALILSGIQLIVTAPLFTTLLFSPKLVVSGGGSSPKNKQWAGTWEVKNDGRETANRIEIGFDVPEGAQVSFLPNIPAKVTREDSQTFQHLKVEIDHLFPKETVLIVIMPNSEGKEISSELMDSLSKIKLFEIPNISYARSSEGAGIIERKSINKEQPI